LERGENEIGDEGSRHGDFVLKALGFALFPRLADLTAISVLVDLIT